MKKPMTVSVDEQLILKLKEIAWIQRLSLSALVEDVLIKGGSYLVPSLDEVKLSNTLKLTKP